MGLSVDMTESQMAQLLRNSLKMEKFSSAYVRTEDAGEVGVKMRNFILFQKFLIYLKVLSHQFEAG